MTSNRYLKKLFFRESGPDFICIGMQKTATNWLYDQLRSNKSFCMPPIKEIHFFDRGFNYRALDRRMKKLLLERSAISYFMRPGLLTNRGKYSKEDVRFFASAFGGRAPELQRNASFKHCQNRGQGGVKGFKLSEDNVGWYKSLFEGFPKNKICGDITPGYSTLSSDEIAELKHYFPDVSIVLGIRDPVKRFWSQANQNIRRRSCDERWLPTVETIRDFLQKEHVQKRSYPSEIYRKWVRSFGSDAIMVYYFEKIKQNPEIVRQEIAVFLGDKDAKFSLDPSFDKKSENQRVEMKDNMKDFLESYFYKEKIKCKQLFPEVTDFWDFS